MLEPVKDALRRAMNDLADTLAGGACDTIEEYRAIAGEIRGLARAERIVLDYLETRGEDAD